MIWGLWDWQAEATIEVKLGDADAESYRFDPMMALLDQLEKIKKDKQNKHWHFQRRHFSPFVISLNGILGREDLIVIVTLSWLMAVKMEEPILHMWGYGRNGAGPWDDV